MAGQLVMEDPDFAGADLASQSDWTSVSGVLTAAKISYITKAALGLLRPRNPWEEVSRNRFMLSNPDFTDTSDVDSHWEPLRFLGEGSFGRCGVWRKYNERSEGIDDVVIKECKSYEEISTVRPFVIGEAAIQRDVQRRERQLMEQSTQSPAVPQCFKDRHIVHLRGYKYNTKSSTCRLYQEHAIWGTLANLFENYDAYDTYFPEPFLWHCLAALSTTCVTMAAEPHESSLFYESWRNANHNFSHKDWFTLHLDVKFDNIFLGSPSVRASAPADSQSTDYTVNYPRLLLGDFGNAAHTSINPGEDVLNPDAYRHAGTQGWKPPEQAASFTDGNWTEPVIDPDELLSDKINIWQVGKVMYDLLTHCRGEEGSDDLDYKISQVTEKEYNARGQHFLPTDFRARRNPDYSLNLRAIVRRCLAPKPADRPTAAELKTIALAGLQIFVLALGQKSKEDLGSGGHDTRRVYYRGNEINCMPLGSEGWTADDWTYSMLTQSEDPDFPLRLPLPKWRKFQENWKLRKVIGTDEVVRKGARDEWVVGPPPVDDSDPREQQNSRVDQDPGLQLSHLGSPRNLDINSTQKKRGTKRPNRESELWSRPRSKRPRSSLEAEDEDDEDQDGDEEEEPSDDQVVHPGSTYVDDGRQVGQYNPSVPGSASKALLAILAEEALKAAKGHHDQPSRPPAKARSSQAQDERSGALGNGSVNEPGDDSGKSRGDRDGKDEDGQPEGSQPNAAKSINPGPPNDPNAQPQSQPQPPPTMTPTQQEYLAGMTIADMVDELQYRNRQLPLKGARSRKSEYARRLVAADVAGATGRGVHKKPKAAPAPVVPVSGGRQLRARRP